MEQDEGDRRGRATPGKRPRRKAAAKRSAGSARANAGGSDHRRGRGTERASAEAGLRIVFEDADILVVDKPAGLLTIATEKEKVRTAYHMLTDRAKESSPRGRIFIVHRLDRETSGLIVFAKSAEMKRGLQEHWNEAVTERSYAAVVEGAVSKKRGTIRSLLAENRAHHVYATRDPEVGKPAVTHYQVLEGNGRFTLLELSLETGRKNQIRVHMQDLGHSVAGDARYGSTVDPIRRLALHARTLELLHPRTHEKLRFESPVPKAFRRLSRQDRRRPPDGV